MAEYTAPSTPGGTTSSVSPAPSGEKKQPHRDQPRIRRRNRLITSCLECRRRKLKCDKGQPCANCVRFSRDCLFIAPALDSAGQAKLADLKEKMGMLEKSLEQDVVRKGSSTSGSGGLFHAQSLPGQEEADSDEDDEEDIKGLEPISIMTEDAAYYEDEDNDEIVDLGIQIGKVRISERIGGFVRPKFREELAVFLQELPKSENEDENEDQDESNPLTEQSPNSWMAPGQDYLAPSSSFFFAPGVEKTTLMNYLPAKSMVDKLMDHYWRAVHLVARTVHRPSFERQYEKFWQDINSGRQPRVSFQAVLFGALLSSTVSMSVEKVLYDFAVAKDELVDNFRQGAESALARANFLHTTKLETLQAFVMYLIPLCRAEITRAHSALTGTCIRLAECMSLHRDPTQYTSNPIEVHIKRLIWYQICFLDLRTCEATGPRPQIRREEFDTRFPLNIDDVDLENSDAVTAEDKKHFTDMTIMRLRLECYEMQRQLWIERPKLEAKRTTLTAILSRIQRFRQAMERTYLPMLHKNHPLHVLAMEIYGILSNRMYVMVLQKFVSNDKRVMPERLRQITISTAVLVIEHSMTIEQTPALAEWSWYLGALQQFQPSLLILSELYSKKPDPAVEARVWRSLDYVFGLPGHLSGAEKTRIVFSELKDRVDIYHSVRRVRAPMHMERPGPRVVEASSPLYADAQDRRRSSSAQSPKAPTDASSRASPPRASESHMQLLNYGSIAHEVDYSLAAEAPNSAGSTAFPAQTSPDLRSFNFAAPPGMTATGMTPISQQQQQHRAGSDASSNVGMGVTTGGSPMDTFPEIDWNEWDKLFGNAEMSDGSILIPPYAFPQFEPTDLQWPAEVFP